MNMCQYEESGNTFSSCRLLVQNAHNCGLYRDLQSSSSYKLVATRFPAPKRFMDAMELDEIIAVIEGTPSAAISVASSVTTDDGTYGDSKTESDVDAVFDLTHKPLPQNIVQVDATRVEPIFIKKHYERVVARQQDDYWRRLLVPSSRNCSRFTAFFEAQIRDRKAKGISEHTEFFFDACPTRTQRTGEERP